VLTSAGDRKVYDDCEIEFERYPSQVIPPFILCVYKIQGHERFINSWELQYRRVSYSKAICIFTTDHSVRPYTLLQGCGTSD